MNAIGRLGRYLEVIAKLPRDKETISSQELATLTGSTPSTVRQDFYTHLDKKGKSRVGYNVKVLNKTLLKLLGMEIENRIVVLGGGKLGRALVGYKEFGKININFAAFFDNAEDKVGQTVDGIEVFHISQLSKYLQDNRDIKMAILAVPAQVAQEVASYAEMCGIEAFWNFSPVLLELSANVVVHNQYIGVSLYQLIFEMKNRVKKGVIPMELMICVGSSCHLKGSEEVVRLFKQLLDKEGVTRKIILKGSFCMGKCSDNGVTVKYGENFYKVRPEDAEKVFYDNILPSLKA